MVLKNLKTIFIFVILSNTILGFSSSLSNDSVLLKLFNKYDTINTISYTRRFVYAGTTDTAVSYEYYQKQRILDGYMYDFHILTKRFDKLHYQEMYNSVGGISVHISKTGAYLTNHKNPPKHYFSVNEMVTSIPVYIQYLKQTYYNHTENICIYDTVLNGEELKVISFTNSDGIVWPDTLISDEQLKEARWPLMLFCDKETLVIRYKKWGHMLDKISNIEYNLDKSGLIWDWNTIPDPIISNLREGPLSSSDCLLAVNSKLPEWNLINLENKQESIIDISSNKLIVLFSLNCGVCIREIPLLNKLNKLNNLVVVGICYDDDISKIKNYIDKHQVGYKVLINDDLGLSEKMMNCGFPVNYLVNKQGNIVYPSRGYSNDLEKIIKGLAR